MPAGAGDRAGVVAGVCADAFGQESRAKVIAPRILTLRLTRSRGDFIGFPSVGYVETGVYLLDVSDFHRMT